MKPSILITAALILAVTSVHAEVRTFTSSAGTTMRGELVSVKGDTVTLKKDDGTPLTLKLAAFSRVDQAWLQTQAAAPPTDGSDPTKATAASPFANSLGMKFVPVPGTNVLMCIHETRRRDYRAHALASSGVDGEWKKLKTGSLSQAEEDEHPVLFVSWEDAKAFCAWLGQKESRTYRLTTDREWSCAVGLGDREQPTASPESLSHKIPGVYPWGTDWPIPAGAGNYYDTTRVKAEKVKKTDESAHMEGYLEGYGYTDGFAGTSPVMKFKPNALGIYDLGGNVWEVCEDSFSPTEAEVVYRGSSYNFDGKNNLLSSARVHQPKTARLGHAGFRVVLELTKKP